MVCWVGAEANADGVFSVRFDMTVIFLGNQLFIQAYTSAFYTSNKPNVDK